jgi:hypothetical protein
VTATSIDRPGLQAGPLFMTAPLPLMLAHLVEVLIINDEQPVGRSSRWPSPRAGVVYARTVCSRARASSSLTPAQLYDWECGLSSREKEGRRRRRGCDQPHSLIEREPII